MAKTITINLSARSINQAIKELEKYQVDFKKKVELLRQKVAERIAKDAQTGFNGAIVDDLTANSGGQRIADVKVTVDERDNITVVVAQGEDAIWVEFGAGVYHNGAAGSSPHPKGSELGFTIGSYGAGYGKKKAWGFYEDGILKVSHGAPAVMPLYRATQTICDDISQLAREVFGR